MTSSQSTLVTRYCGIWGSVGIVAVLLQFLPQIYKCYQLKVHCVVIVKVPIVNAAPGLLKQ